MREQIPKYLSEDCSNFMRALDNCFIEIDLETLGSPELMHEVMK